MSKVHPFRLLVTVVAGLATIVPTAKSSLPTADEDSIFQTQSNADGFYRTTSPTEIPRQQGRTFGPFRILSLAHPNCRFDSRRNGTCMPSTECISAGGRFESDSVCNPALGVSFGTCCLLEQTCGGVIRKNNTYFVNPGFPEATTEPQTCDVAVAVNLASRRACYLRLDFKNFTVHAPSGGKCQVDQFWAPQFQPLTVPELCGHNSGSHMYIYVKEFSSHQNLTLRFNLGEWLGARHWMVNVAVIDCGQDWTPPSRSCLQYHFNAKDSIRSFNYNELNPEESSLLRSLHYTVCIRQAPTKCFTRWTSNFFSLSASNKTSVVGDSCQKSYVAISQGLSQLKEDVTHDRYCGEVFGPDSGSASSSEVYSAANPVNIQVHHSHDFKSLGTGFYLNYTQLQCTQRRANDGILSWLASFLPSFIRGRSEETPADNSTQKTENMRNVEEPQLSTIGAENASSG